MKQLIVIALLAITALSGLGCASSQSSSLSNSSNIVNDVQEFTVDGIPVLMRQSTASPVVSAILFIRGGTTAVRPDQPVSIEAFAMRVAAASGSQRMGKSYFRRRLVQMGTGIGGEDGGDYSALTLKCTRENLDTSWAYFTDVALRPVFDSAEFENFRKAVLINLAGLPNNADAYSKHIADSIYLQGSVYGRTLTAEDVNRPTLASAAEHFKSLMVKSRFLLSVVGNISREELTKKIETTLGKLPEGNYEPPVVAPPSHAFAPAAYFPKFQRKLPTDYVLGYYLIPSKGDPDYYAYLRLRNFFGGFVFNHIRVQHNLAYAPNVDDKEGRVSIGVVSFQTPYVDSAVKIVFDDIDFFQNNRIRESAIKEGVAGWATRNYLKAETTESQAVLLGQAKLTTGDWRNAFFDYKKLSNVTADELVAVARKYLRNINWIVVGDTTNVDRALLESR